MNYTVYCKKTKEKIGEIGEFGAVALLEVFNANVVLEPAESDEPPVLENFYNKIVGERK